MSIEPSNIFYNFNQNPDGSVIYSSVWAEPEKLPHKNAVLQLNQRIKLEVKIKPNGSVSVSTFKGDLVTSRLAVLANKILCCFGKPPFQKTRIMTEEKINQEYPCKRKEVSENDVAGLKKTIKSFFDANLKIEEIRRKVEIVVKEFNKKMNPQDAEKPNVSFANMPRASNLALDSFSLEDDSVEDDFFSELKEKLAEMKVEGTEEEIEEEMKVEDEVEEEMKVEETEEEIEEERPIAPTNSPVPEDVENIEEIEEISSEAQIPFSEMKMKLAEITDVNSQLRTIVKKINSVSDEKRCDHISKYCADATEKIEKSRKAPHEIEVNPRNIESINYVIANVNTHILRLKEKLKLKSPESEESIARDPIKLKNLVLDSRLRECFDKPEVVKDVLDSLNECVESLEEPNSDRLETEVVLDLSATQILNFIKAYHEKIIKDLKKEREIFKITQLINTSNTRKKIFERKCKKFAERQLSLVHANKLSAFSIKETCLWIEQARGYIVQLKQNIFY